MQVGPFLLDGETSLPAVDWRAKIASARLSYTGETVSRALELSWPQVAPALPPADLSGQIDAVALAAPAVQRILLEPELTVLPRSEWPPELKRTRARAPPDKPSQWPCQGVIAHSPCHCAWPAPVSM